MSTATEKVAKYDSFLHCYCPKCNKRLNEDNNEANEHSNQIHLFIKHKDMLGSLWLNPSLDNPEISTDIPMSIDEIHQDIICPHCKSTLVESDKPCESCGSHVAKLTVSAPEKLLPYYVCLKYGCKWHGISAKEQRHVRIKVPRQSMAEQDALIRIKNFKEVPYGYTQQQAMLEASRCLHCKRPLCVDGCPVEIDIPGFIKLISEKKFTDAAELIKKKNALPAVCARVCPQEDQCEKLCILGNKDRPVSIGNLERFVADYERMMGVKTPLKPKSTGRSVGIVGSGPSGLTLAADMVLDGHGATIYEALHEPGGVLTYGIPEFRLPKEIVHAEIDYLKRMGVRIELNTVIGRTMNLDDMLEKHDAVFIGSGAGLPVFMGIPGENLCNIFSANEYLTRTNLMKAFLFPKYDTPSPVGLNVAVIGGGNVAMDCARNALRLGARNVYIIYRRSRTEMPARHEEIARAEQEGVIFKFITAPVRYIGNEDGWVSEMELIQMKLGEPDASGRRRPEPIPGSNYRLDVDLVVVAVGAGPNPLLFQGTVDIKRNKWGYIETDENLMTSVDRVYAGGDIVRGAATVILAMGDARTVSKVLKQRWAKEDAEKAKQKEPITS